jgi:hypothetical protein
MLARILALIAVSEQVNTEFPFIEGSFLSSFLETINLLRIDYISQEVARSRYLSVFHPHKLVVTEISYLHYAMSILAWP